MEVVERTDDRDWHLDKRVPISMIVVLVAQILSFVYVFAQLNTKVDTTIERQDKVEQQLEDRLETIMRNSTGVAVTNTSIRNIEQSLQRIERKLDNES